MHTLRFFLCFCLVSTLSAFGQAPNGWDFFKPADMEKPTASPESGSIGFIARDQNRAKLYRLVLASGKIEGLFDPGDADIHNFWWLTETQLLLAANGKDGLVFLSLDTQTGKHQAIPPLTRAWSWDLRAGGFPREQLVAGFRDKPDDYYLAQVNLRTGREKRISGIPGSPVDTIVSANGELRSRAWMQGSTWKIEWRESAKAPWQKLSGKGELPAFYPIAMDADDRHLLVLAYDEGKTTALMRLDPATGKREPIAQNASADIAELIQLDGSSTLTGVTFSSFEQESAQWLSGDLDQLARKLQSSLPGKNTRIISRSQNAAATVVANWDTGQPVTYFILANNQLARLGQERAVQLTSTTHFTFKTRSGRQLFGYLTRAKNASSTAPLIVITPEFFQEYRNPSLHYHAATNYLASRGYTVAHFVLPGMSGFGREFEQFGSQPLDQNLVSDLEDGITELEKSGLATKSRVAVYGYGNEALVAIYAATNSALFRAVVAHNPGDRIYTNRRRWQDERSFTLIDAIREDVRVSVSPEIKLRYDPAKTLPALKADLLLLYGGAHDENDRFYDESIASLRRSAARTQGKHTWATIPKPSPKRSDALCDFEAYTKVVDFLDGVFQHDK